MIRKPELMSPAGQWPQLRAALEAGADAVYFGLDQFSARAKVGFTLDELPQVMGCLHERGVQGFVTFNTLVFDSELATAETTIQRIAAAGADSVIVQDLGMASLIREIAPELPIHGSTQMSVTSAQGCELAKSFGCTRVVLARELSLADISRIAAATDIELETFVHGALCVSYSGQCFSSEAWGGRSANRGQCAQACRLSYDLIVDDQVRDTGENRYLLSPGDLFALDQVPELMKIGIACFKIEGRYKDENYVALTTAAYRRRIDQVWNGESVTTDASTRQSLEQVYSRGLHPSFISGVNHQNVVKGRAPRHRGLLAGQVLHVDDDGVVIRENAELVRPLKNGDGIVFDSASWRSPDEPEEGGPIYRTEASRNHVVKIYFADGAIDLQRIRSGDLVWRTSDPGLIRQWKSLAVPKTIRYTKPVGIQLTAESGRPLKATMQLDCHIESLQPVSIQSSSVLQPARQRSITEELLREQLGRLGGTPFHLERLQVDWKGKSRDLFLPIRELNEMRRQLVEKLLQQRRQRNRRRLTTSVLPCRISKIADPRTGNSKSDCNTDMPRLHVLVRSPQQLDAVIRLAPNSITLDYLELYGLRTSVEKIRAAGGTPRVASPRILKPSEQNVVQFLRSLDCEILVRSGGLLYDLLRLECGSRLIGDFSLNVANALTAELLLDQGLDRITPTYDLNAAQVVELARQIGPANIEAIAYSHLPVFHTEHCVFCRFLSEGTDHTNCGHPCEKHKLALRDKSGRAHPVMADVGCRNTVFGSEAQFAGPHLPAWIEAKIRDYRVEFVHETPAEIEEILMLFQQAFRGILSHSELARRLRSTAPAGTTLGSYFVPRDQLGVVRRPGPQSV